MPTYWKVERGEVLTFRSAADAADANSEIDIDRLAALACGLAPVDDEASLFRGVRRVPQGVRVVIDADGSSKTFSTRREHSQVSLPPIDAAEELWRLTCASVARSIRGAGRVAVLTGGGVDSGALLGAAVAVARGATAQEVMAIALDFAGDGDDRPYLRELEHAFGIEAIRVAPQAAARDVAPLLTHSHLPIWAAGSAGDLSLLRCAKENDVDIVLTGIGGDDLLDGYPRLLADDAARGDLGAAVLAARLEVPWSSGMLRNVLDFIARPLVARAMSPNFQRDRRRHLHRAQWPWAGPTLSRFIDVESARWARPRFDTPSARFNFLSEAWYLADVVELCDELANIASVKVRHPYLDEDLLAFISSLPPRALLQSGRLRGLFRLAIRGRIPEVVRLRNSKASFANARREMLKAAGGVHVLADLATMRKSAEAGLVEPISFGEAFKSFTSDLDGDDTRWSSIWPALAIEGFLRARSEQASSNGAGT